MLRFLAGAASCFLLLTGAFLLWQSRAERPGYPPRLPARAAAPPLTASALGGAPGHPQRLAKKAVRPL